MFKYFMPTKVLVGASCVMEKSNEMILGKKAFIVTGRSSGKRSGALSDVEEVLKNAKIPYYVYDKIENNPEITDMARGGKVCRSFGADFIIAIGGGSPRKCIDILLIASIENLISIPLKRMLCRNIFPIYQGKPSFPSPMLQMHGGISMHR